MPGANNQWTATSAQFSITWILEKAQLYSTISLIKKCLGQGLKKLLTFGF